MDNLAVMRRVPVLLALALIIALSGCGGSDHKPASPLADALGYFPKDAPFVAAIETDPNGPQLQQVRSLVGRLPGVNLLAFRLQNFARVRNIDGDDIRPQLGAPLVVGLEKPVVPKDLDKAVVVAMRIKHPIKAKQVLLRQPGFRGRGKASGVRIYENTNESRYVAVDGRMLVAAANREVLEHALELKRDDQNRMEADSFQADLAGLPTGGLIRVSGDPQMLLGADARLRPALGVKWIAALRRMGVVAKASDTGVTLDFRIASDKHALSDKDLPLDPRPQVLQLIGSKKEIQVSLAGPDRLVRLAFAVWHKISPVKAAAFDAAQPHGVDLERQIPHHLVGPAAFAIDPTSRSFEFRSVLNEAADVRDALTVLAPRLPDLGAFFGIKGLGIGSPTSGENFYALAKTNGQLAVFGVVGNSLVIASDPGRAAGLASEPTHTVSGAKGSAVVTLDARNLVGNLIAKQLRGPAGLLAPFIASSLRDLTGTLTIDRSALHGHFKLTIVK